MCFIHVLSKYAWVVPSKDKKGITITRAFQKILKEKSNERKPNKIWVDKGSEFYNSSFKKWLKDNDIECIRYITKENLLLLSDLSEL